MDNEHTEFDPQDEPRPVFDAEVVPLSETESPQSHSYVRGVRHRPRLALVLFLATVASTFFAGMGTIDSHQIENPKDRQAVVKEYVRGGISFSLSLLLILGCHEMGHYLQSRRYGVSASLPYFIPFPISPFGTLGAVIFQGFRVTDGRVHVDADRKALYDIAITGPLAGLVIALPVAYIGMTQSRIDSFEGVQNVMRYGDPLILKWMISYVHGPLGPNEDVVLNPILFAGWAGIFVTALNLVPIGQLDGGHILYALVRRRSHLISTMLLLFAIGYMIYFRYFAYVLIIVLLVISGPRHPPTADDNAPLGTFRIILGWLTLAFLFIGFTPTPLIM